jgi:hypothetical protein
MILPPEAATSFKPATEDVMSHKNSHQNPLSIVYQALADLKPRATNPRTHSKKQIAQIANAIRRFGFTNPVLVDDANGIIAGHGRVEAANLWVSMKFRR